GRPARLLEGLGECAEVVVTWHQLLERAGSVVLVPRSVAHCVRPRLTGRSKALGHRLRSSRLSWQRAMMHLVEPNSAAQPELRQLRGLRFAKRCERRAFPLEGMRLPVPYQCQCAQSKSV